MNRALAAIISLICLHSAWWLIPVMSAGWEFEALMGVGTLLVTAMIFLT